MTTEHIEQNGSTLRSTLASDPRNSKPATEDGQQEFGALLFAGRSTLYVSEVAEKLRITEQHVRNLIDEGKLLAVNVGTNERKFWRIPMDEYERFLKKNFSIHPIEPTQG